MSDFPYYQDPTTSCVATQYNCFSQIKKQYGENLKNGFLTKEKQYHPALRYFILINEPDLKMPRTANSAPGDAPWSQESPKFTKSSKFRAFNLGLSREWHGFFPIPRTRRTTKASTHLDSSTFCPFVSRRLTGTHQDSASPFRFAALGCVAGKSHRQLFRRCVGC